METWTLVIALTFAFSGYPSVDDCKRAAEAYHATGNVMIWGGSRYQPMWFCVPSPRDAAVTVKR